MTKKERARQAVDLLAQEYPVAICSLCYGTPFQLLIATRLSAQCTDARVNMVTPSLFARFPDAESMAAAELGEVEELIKTCGLYKTKAKDIIGISKAICESFGGNVPETMEELLTLPGVGRKTANLVLGDVFGKPAIVTDTHFIRIVNRIGLTDNKEPYKVECDLKNLLPPTLSNDFCHRTVLHGRAVCTARKAYCEKCVLNEICKKVNVK